MDVTNSHQNSEINWNMFFRFFQLFFFALFAVAIYYYIDDKKWSFGLRRIYIDRPWEWGKERERESGGIDTPNIRFSDFFLAFSSLIILLYVRIKYISYIYIYIYISMLNAMSAITVSCRIKASQGDHRVTILMRRKNCSPYEIWSNLRLPQFICYFSFSLLISFPQTTLVLISRLVRHVLVFLPIVFSSNDVNVCSTIGNFISLHFYYTSFSSFCLSRRKVIVLFFSNISGSIVNISRAK